MDWSIPKFPLDDICDQALTWLTGHGSDLTRAVSKVVTGWIEVSTDALVAVPPWLTIAAFVALAWRIGGLRIAVLTAAGLAFLWNLRLWQPTMETLVLVTLSTVAALLIGIPIGIACALSGRTWKTVGPCLDMAQTMPSFVYLIPAIPFFGLGSVSACFATIIFAMPPVIRLTALGIRQVPHELIEASDAFGSTPVQKLFKVQFPLALPTIMAGINQTIMLALSMVVIAAMIGAGGLGREVWRSIQRLEAGVGFETGIAIVILAVILDRLTQTMAQRMRPSGATAR
jgi:glycine betaine/proline transport system permease protein